MFAGRRRRSSNIRVMQLFHELKQQFPTVPDHVVSSCIATHSQSPSSNKDKTIREILEAAAALNQQQEPMGRSPPQPETPTLTLSKDPFCQDATTPHEPPIPQSQDFESLVTERKRSEMNDSDSDPNRNVIKSAVTYSKKFESVNVSASNHSQTTVVGRSSFFAKRPDHLDLKQTTIDDSSRKSFEENSGRLHNIQLSRKSKDVHQLLNSGNVSDKPPRSPLNNKRPLDVKSSPTATQEPRGSQSPSTPLDAQKRLHPEEARSKRETASTPTQTTDTLLGGNSVNLSLNVNCSMDLVQSPTKRLSALTVTPQQPWLQDPVSPRSYTSVNLTLRPPSSEPQPLIDITSHNSSLTYSTSSFDSQKGLQSRLQITVGPGGGSVASVRTRPRSSYHPEGSTEEVVPVRAGSLNNLVANSEPPLILKQQARIERLRIELKTEKANLIVLEKEVADLEKSRLRALEVEHKIDVEVEKQLRKEIKHLQYQCEQLAIEVDKNTTGDTHEDFYHNIYTGQRGPLNLDFPRRRPNRGRMQYTEPPLVPMTENEGPKWNCHICTFLNHPDLDKCEQCEMPRILHGKNPSNPNITYSMQQASPNNNYHLAASQSLPDFHHQRQGSLVITRPIGFDLSFLANAANQHLNRTNSHT